MSPNTGPLSNPSKKPRVIYPRNWHRGMKRLSAALLIASLLIATVPLTVSADETQDIPANAAGTGNHNSLVAALDHANLTSVLQQAGPYTVFAPTDAAFAAAGIDLANYNTDAANETLRDILLYHVLPGAVPAANVTDGLEVTMANGDNASFTVAPTGAVSIEGANVTTADVNASNGIIHVIDQVLTPPADVVAPSPGSFIEVANSTGVHTLLLEALTATQLNFLLTMGNNLTLFAPTDAAFAAAGVDSAFIQNESNTAQLAYILSNHVLSAVVLAADVTDGMELMTGYGGSLTAAVANGNVSVAGATVITADVMTDNGVIHVVDSVFTLPSITQMMADMLLRDGDTNNDSMISWTEFEAFVTEDDEDFSGSAYETASMGHFNQSDANNDSMLNASELLTFAELESAYVADDTMTAPQGEICYNMATHTIVPGADQATCEAYQYVENMTMGTMTYTGCYNTVTHQITNVSQAVCDAYMWTPAVSIAMTAQATGIHASLVAALGVAGLVDTLSGTTNYTVFAPSDAAFEAAGINLSAYTTTEEIAVLADILLYHVVAGTTMSTDLTEGATTVTAANGDNLTISVTGTSVMVGATMANVTLADVPASNGVIHVIDQVLMPPADEPAAVDPFEGVTCAATIGIGPSGYAYSPSLVNIDVGETVCWSWTDASMPHNVKEVDGYQSETYTMNGITSGAAMTTVNFHHTFTEDTTFYYACEPHIGLDMFGEVVVGDGGEGTGVVTEPVDDEAEDTPGFVMTSALIALAGAVLLAGRRTSDTEE